MWDFIKLLCVEKNGSAWVHLAAMTSAKDDQFVLSNLSHPVKQLILQTRTGEAEPEEIIPSINFLVPEPRTGRELMNPPPFPPSPFGATPAPRVSRGAGSRRGRLDPSGWHVVNYVLALHTAAH